jgi:AcrR family transcriptional regulator
MPRPRSDDKRAAIMAAATRIIAAQGLSAPTAAIAKEAGVSNGSLFTYFSTKADLLNQLYLELKTEMGTAATAGLPAAAEPREQLQYLWTRWLGWAAANPEKRRVLALLGVSDEVTPTTHTAAGRSMAGLATVLERGRAEGPMAQEPLGFVLGLANALAEATIDFIIREPQNTDAHSAAGFGALWRLVGRAG